MADSELLNPEAIFSYFSLSLFLSFSLSISLFQSLFVPLSLSLCLQGGENPEM